MKGAFPAHCRIHPTLTFHIVRWAHSTIVSFLRSYRKEEICVAIENRAFDLETKTKARVLGLDNWKHLRPLVDTAPECIKVVAPDGRLLQMNPAGLTLIDAPSWESVEGACVFDLVATEYRQFWRDYHNRVCRGETLTWQFDIVGLAGRLNLRHATSCSQKIRPPIRRANTWRDRGPRRPAKILAPPTGVI